MPAKHATRNSPRHAQLTRALGHSLVLAGGLTLGTTTGMILTGHLYLPLLTTTALLLLLGTPVIAVAVGALIAGNRARSITGATTITLTVIGGLILGATQLNLGLSQQTLLNQLPLTPSSNTTTETPWHPNNTSTLTIVGNPTQLMDHLAEHTDHTTGTNPLTRPLSLGKTLTISVDDTDQRNTITVSVTP